ncbi:MAG: hypothetical protein KGH64_02965 [Candidatus Micrarchaeota archaeon]|nr:hypothetical protein [Candidatus Micrarchaeota archaeon]MDE1834274.1 hypothetical protein [Candidatus Micrarchaeota archaeon]MDE1859414.1 hypothetical protein [Candidatus Micrarchaeota archaeon]
MLAFWQRRTKRRAFASNLSVNMVHAGYKHLENGNVDEGKDLLRAAAKSHRLVGCTEEDG